MSISISEIMVVLVVALLVMKPEQLPSAAFKLGQWTKQCRRMMAQLRREMDDVSSSAVKRDEKPAVLQKIEMNNNEP